MSGEPPGPLPRTPRPGRPTPNHRTGERLAKALIVALFVILPLVAILLYLSQ